MRFAPSWKRCRAQILGLFSVSQGLAILNRYTGRGGTILLERGVAAWVISRAGIDGIEFDV